MQRIVLVAVALGALSTAAWGGNWPAWRGPQGNGVSEETGLPTQWSEQENITWKVPLAEPGNSTPIVWGDRIFLTTQKDGTKIRTLACFNRADGQLLWQEGVSYVEKDPTHATNPYCSASPVTDGERVIAWFGSAGLFCFDFNGKVLWQRDLGKFEHVWGYAASPVIYGDLVLCNLGPGLTAFVAAYDKKTGADVWRRDLPEIVSEKSDQFKGSWSTPVLREIGGRTEMLVSLPKQLRAFDPRTGEDLWQCDGLSDLVYTSVLTGPGNIVVAMSGYHGPSIGVRAPAGSQGNITADGQLWRHTQKNPQRVGSGVIVGEHYFMLNESGVAECTELSTGNRLWQERVSGSTWSSMTYVDGKLYVLSMDGQTWILDPKTDYKLIAQNKLNNDTTRASHAFSDGQIFIRTYKNLYCIGERKK